MNNSIFDENTFETGISSEPITEDEDTITTVEGEEDQDEGNMMPEGFLDFLSHMSGMMSSDDDDDDDDNEASDMDADDIHNKAVEYARRGKSREAAEICMKGLTTFPLNVDLLADTIKYSSEAGEMGTATKHYNTLKEKVPFQRWNWRAFTFAFDFLMKENPIANECECRSIVENYKVVLPYEERAYAVNILFYFHSLS